MKASDLVKLIGKPVTIRDTRTGFDYQAPVLDAKLSYGSLRISIQPGTWFQADTSTLKALEAVK